MKKLLYAEFLRRVLYSIIFHCEIFFLLLYNLWKIWGTNYGFEINANYFLFYNLKYICFFIALNTTIHINQDFDYRTINNKLFCGYKKLTFYQAETIISILQSFLLFVFDNLSILVFCRLKRYDINVFSTSFIMANLFLLLILTTISIFSTMLATFISHRIFSLFVVVGLTLVLLFYGGQTVSRLNEPQETTLYPFSQDGAPVSNPLYLDENERLLPKIHLLISPYSQIQYAPCLMYETCSDLTSNSVIFKGFQYHYDFLIINIFEIIAFYICGQLIFIRRDFR